MAKMTDTDLLTFLREESKQARNYGEAAFDGPRNKATRAYMRKPYGNEEEGRSTVVASDVFDAVEGILPDLLDPFVSSDKAVVFEPVSEEDVDGAEQATAACNYVFYKQNNGFLILYTAIKDALLLKNGGVKWYWEKRRTPKFETFAGDEIAIAAHLMANPKAQVVSKEEIEPTSEELAQYQAVAQEYAAQGFQVPPMPVRYKLKLKTIEEKGRVRVEPVPPDEIAISQGHNSVLLDECAYVAHTPEKTRSEIKEMGFEIGDAADDSEDGSDLDDYRESDYEVEHESTDPAMQKLRLREEYVLVDYDGDGIAERRKITRIGSTILENIEVSHVQMAIWTPYILTHRFDGLSVADLVEDFQRAHTEIWRAQLDNLALANTQETVVLTDSQGNVKANIDDLLNRRPGGIIREFAPGAVRPYNERWQGLEAMPMLEQMASSKENRIGYTRYSQGLDGQSLNKTATGVSMIMNAGQRRMKLMARILAECMVKPMFRGIFKTLTDYCMEPLSMRLTNKFVAYDPQEWRDGYDMSVNVGLGQGDEMQQSAFLQQMAQAQAMVAGSPLGPKLITPKNIYNLQVRLAENAGFKNPNEFWTDPGDGPMPTPQPQPDPKIQLKQMDLQADAQKFQAESQLTRELEALKLQAKQRETQMQLELQAANDMRDGEREQMKAQLDAELEQMRIASAEAIAQLQSELARYKTDADNQTRITVALINKGASQPAETPDEMGEQPEQNPPFSGA